MAAVLLPIASSLPVHGAAWVDATLDAGLDGNEVSRLKSADLTGNDRPDLIMMPDGETEAPPRIFLHTIPADSEGLFTYVEKRKSGLPPLQRSDILVFADMNNNGILDAVLGRNLDIYQEDYDPPGAEPLHTSWFPGNGDGSFGPPKPIPEAPMATTLAIAVGDVNLNGRLDLFIGNGYERYFTGYEAFENDLLLQYESSEGSPAFVRWPMPHEALPTDYTDDLGGRPSYGVALPRLDDGLPMLLELNYGRRWNRLYRMSVREPLYEIDWPAGREPGPLKLREPAARGAHLVRQLRGENIAAQAKVDGDAIRHGRHPDWWPEEAAAGQPRVRRPDEPPFRANGNTFDVAVGDIDNDGDFDLFFSTIIHAWAGESSDRSRFLVNQLKETGQLRFHSFEHLSVDRIPPLPEPGEPLEPIHTQYNQGDIYAELADLNHNGRLDLILCSSDYPDPPPYEERLRIYFQQEDGRFRDVTAQLGIDHIGAGMPTLADVTGNGALDLIVGQSFNRLPAPRRRAASIASGALSRDAPHDARPERRARLFLNGSTEGRDSLVLYLQGDPARGIAANALGAIVRVKANLDGDSGTPEVSQTRQLLGPGGHAGKQHAFLVHVGLGEANKATRVEIVWPDAAGTTTVFKDLQAGSYRIKPDGSAPRRIRQNR